MSEHLGPRVPASDRYDLYRRAIIDSFVKLDPRTLYHNVVMFTVEIGSVITTLLWIQALFGPGEAPASFIGAVSLWLWFTVLFANFAEALAEGRGKAQAEALKKMRQDTSGKKLNADYRLEKGKEPGSSDYTTVSSSKLRKNDVFYVKAGDTIPVDGEVIEGIASVNESAITGESAPVIRESGGDRSAVTGGTTILSDWLIVRVSADPGEGFLDHMISLIEGAKRQRTPNEIALNILLVGLTAIFVVVSATLYAFSAYSVQSVGAGTTVTITVLVALFVCLAPTTIGGLLSAIGIAGMDRLIRRNVITTSGRAIEAAGDVDVLLLDKTGTITLGNRQAVEFIPVDDTRVEELAENAQLASLADETPEGRSIVVLAKERYGLRGRSVGETESGVEMEFIPFTSQTRMSGVDYNGTRIRKGAADAMYAYIESNGGTVTENLKLAVDMISRAGGTPLVVAKNGRALGVIHLKDIVKGGIKERFAQLRKMGIKTVMITGDNKLTAATIAAEAGVDDFLAEATPESKLKLIREYQTGGRMVAMTGDGTNDAPALAQADVAVAMNTGTQPAREAANMVDLDSNPTKLIDIVEIGKQLLMTRGALTTFSIANDIAKYFAIIPVAFASTYPALGALNVLGLHDGILSAVIFNAIIIVILIPLALHGVKYRAMSAEESLRNNILIYGVGGLIAPFIGIKLIDMLLVLLGA
ncbi:K+-transporting ATPase, B subunit [Methanoregula boonei 6A8]|uniref:Potassium-transporting ATPase ATP-binding subunit n=1 Tax=Methanoregula boonei (strain DSM 21154 / JCM 14090 / 6A8) TaxID=456442 RepID=A7I5F1_METB6|nr:potassium-transporting ATPase subunit KdpB [Methanoregula boonei]ABS54962.1 K+-transporting ATPase, B subunit [Methanoregula boonei 6A8]